MKLRKPNRLKHYNYSNAGWYFVTICTHNHNNYFGNIVKNKMILNKMGEIVYQYWKNISILHKHIDLDYFIIMPNHIHGIIIISYVEDANFASSTYDRTKMELSKLIQQFKRAITMKIKNEKHNINFKWQRSFYDRIIRNEKELYIIRKYIDQNPLRWDLEKIIDNLEI